VPYLDHNATTPLRPEVRAAWNEALDTVGGNPSSLHASGRRARHLLDEARARTAAALRIGEDEVVFTSGGTESNNLAVLGVLRRWPDGAAGPRRLVLSAVEHSSVLGPARALEHEGVEIQVVPVDRSGLVDPDAVAQASAGARLVSVMAANNEVGSCMPLGEIGERLRRLDPRPRFHTDAVQALGRSPVTLSAWGVDLASFSAHKVGGPAGVGVLVRRSGVDLVPLCYGGEQEFGLRPGTENVAAISAAALAFELAVREQRELAARLSTMAKSLWTELERSLNGVRLLGPAIDDPRRLPGTLNVLARGHDGKVLVMRLDLEGLECSAGSACASGSLEPSHVLRALGLDDDAARAGLRLSFGRTNHARDVEHVVDILRRTLGDANAKSGRATSS
jgi:cysteine desulfurase